MIYTKEPWEVDAETYRVDTGDSQQSSLNCYAVFDSKKLKVADIINHFRSSEEAKGNAYIIADAPEMLKLLSEAWLELDNALQTYLPDGEDRKDMAELCGKIEAIIQKYDDPE